MWPDEATEQSDSVNYRQALVDATGFHAIDWQSAVAPYAPAAEAALAYSLGVLEAEADVGTVNRFSWVPQATHRLVLHWLSKPTCSHAPFRHMVCVCPPATGAKASEYV